MEIISGCSPNIHLLVQFSGSRKKFLIKQKGGVFKIVWPAVGLEQMLHEFAAQVDRSKSTMFEETQR
ncbi:hypothetical protein L596_029753 [Steinernema carpocapsae]|uniref:Uncharacterized protein n=1 Tax=Steinernema carpocapsae TaxID=34508 RepID=A0A4U5LQP2_STECR|nr:hypothetical protein L596_029753 [Steinernema carpocapsae]